MSLKSVNCSIMTNQLLEPTNCPISSELKLGLLTTNEKPRMSLIFLLPQFFSQFRGCWAPENHFTAPETELQLGLLAPEGQRPQDRVVQQPGGASRAVQGLPQSPSRRGYLSSLRRRVKNKRFLSVNCLQRFLIISNYLINLIF